MRAALGVPVPRLHALGRGGMNIALAFAEISGAVLLLEHIRRRPSIAEVQALVCSHFFLRPVAMTCARRSREVARPRQIAMYLCREHTPRSLPQIGRAFGGRDHSTVMHACRQVERFCSADPAFAATVASLSAELVERAKRPAA